MQRRDLRFPFTIRVSGFEIAACVLSLSISGFNFLISASLCLCGQ